MDADTQVMRYDALGELMPAHRRPDGTLFFEGRPAKVGILEYRDASGKVTREFVPASTLFSEDAMSTLGRAPLTLAHPSGGRVTPDNIDEVLVGDTDSDVVAERTAEGGFVRVKGAVRRRDALDAIAEGVHELSVGYLATVDPTPGEWMGRPYDAVQKTRLANHIAIVPQGRAGSDVALRADSQDAIMIGAARPQEDRMPAQTGSVEIKGVRFNALDPALATAIAETIKDKEDADAKASGEFAKMQGEIDALKAVVAKRDEEIVAFKKAAKDAKDAAEADEDPKAMKDKKDAADAAFLVRVDAFVPLRAMAVEYKVDAHETMLEPALRSAILGAVNPELKLDGKSADYIAAAVDVHISARGKADAASADVAGIAAGLRTDGTREVVAQKLSAQERHDADTATYLANQSGVSAE